VIKTDGVHRRMIVEYEPNGPYGTYEERLARPASVSSILPVFKSSRLRAFVVFPACSSAHYLSHHTFRS